MEAKYLFPELRLDADFGQVNDRNNQRVDASVFFSRELEHMRAAALEEKFPELKARSFVPILNVANWAETVRVEVFKQVGKAQTRRNLADAGPTVEIEASEYYQVIRPITQGYQWTMQEARASAATGKQLDARKARAARRAIDTEIDEVILFGNDNMGLKGLTNYAGTSITPAAGNYGGLSADAIIADLSAFLNGMKAATNQVWSANYCLMPDTTLSYLETTRLTDSSVTIMDFIRKTFPGVTFEGTYSLETAGAGNVKRVLAYHKSDEVLEAIIGQEFEQLAPQFVDYKVKVPCHARHGGVMVHHPLALRYLDGV